MTTFALIITCLTGGYLAGSITGFFIGKEITEAPEILDPDDMGCPRIKSDYWVDERTGDLLKHSFSTYPEKMADGTEREIIIRNN